MRVSFGEVDGKEWEAYCQKLFRLRYRDSYQEVPAKYGGDFGVEGFTTDGLLFQCYCPDDEPSGRDLYEAQRDKITRDIEKLKKNYKEIVKLGSGTIQTWHFVTPKYDSKDLLSHCRKKEKEIQNLQEPEFHSDFSIRILVEDDFIPEREHLISTGIHRIDPIEEEATEEELNQWLNSNNEIVDKIKRKVAKITSESTNQAALTEKIVSAFLVGKNEIENLNNNFPTTHQKFKQLKASIEKETAILCLTSPEDPKESFRNIMGKYEASLDQEFSNSMAKALIKTLTQEAIADWLGSCSLDF